MKAARKMIPFMLVNFPLCLHLYTQIMGSTTETSGFTHSIPLRSVRLPFVLLPAAGVDSR